MEAIPCTGLMRNALPEKFAQTPFHFSSPPTPQPSLPLNNATTSYAMPLYSSGMHSNIEFLLASVVIGGPAHVSVAESYSELSGERDWLVPALNKTKRTLHNCYIDVHSLHIRKEALTDTLARYIEGTFLRIERLDVFTATTVFCLCEDETDIVDRHRQKLYHETYSAFLPLAHDQLVRCVAELAS